MLLVCVVSGCKKTQQLSGALIWVKDNRNKEPFNTFAEKEATEEGVLALIFFLFINSFLNLWRSRVAYIYSNTAAFTEL